MPGKVSGGKQRAVQPAACYRAGKAGKIDAADADLGAGNELGEGCERQGEERVVFQEKMAEVQAVLRKMMLFSGKFDRLLQLLQQRSGPPVKKLPGRRQLGLPRAAVEQGKVQLLFEPGDLVGNGGLRKIQSLGSLRKTLAAGDF